MPLEVTLVTPERRLLEQVVCHEVEMPGRQGTFGVLEGHTLLMTPLTVGVVRLFGLNGENEEHETLIAISGGFAQVGPQQVLITAHAAETEGDIDAVRAEAALRRAQQRLKNRQGVNLERAELAVARALNRMRLARKKHHI
jgi:F-type H+-transporting ATPase subunit epsilon